MALACRLAAISRAHEPPVGATTDSKCCLASAMFSNGTAGSTESPAPPAFCGDKTTIKYVLEVKTSMNAVKREFWTSIFSNCAWDFAQLSLNCLTMFEIFSKRCASAYCCSCACVEVWQITRNVARSNSTTSSARQIYASQIGAKTALRSVIRRAQLF